MREVDISIVTYRPDIALLEQLLASLAGSTRQALARHLFIQDNGPNAQWATQRAALANLGAIGAFESFELNHSETNLGFGRGHNANAARGSAPFILVLNQDCIVEPETLEPLLEAAERDHERVAVWEMRQIPYEHPKDYDPVTLETSWVSAAAVLIRRASFEEVGGFEPRIFMYGEDVDLSWRLRARGWRLTYQPRYAVVHRSYRVAHEVKPLQVLGGVLTNLGLRARYGGVFGTLKGLAMLGVEILAPQSFPGRRWGLVKAGLAFLVRWPYFVWTAVRPSAHFKPHFVGWGYELRRDGAFHEFASKREHPHRPQPMVSILIRTVDRPAWLREALTSCANQTYRHLEVVVIEDGPERSRAIIEEFRDRLA
ncbi:MAG TPA: glycosyltransferase, partial [Usitatibacter sp.]|nr:glycosyltransferase [Usitatibacter sp.]